MDYVKFTILQTSDLHGNIFPLVYSTNTETPIGLGKISTIIKEERKKNKHVLLIDNGDLIQGTPLTYHYAKINRNGMNPTVKILNELRYDAAIIGNHEFNYGRNILQETLSQSEFPWLSANILEKESNQPFAGKPYISKIVEGIKLVLLGLTTHYIPNWEDPIHIEGLTFEIAFTSAKKWISYIKENEHPDILIVSYHGGFERDIQTGELTEVPTGENQGYKMCQELNGIDVLLTGHQHRAIAGQINGVTVLQPSYNGKAVGKVEITIDKQDKTIINKSSELLFVDHHTPTDEQLLSLVQKDELETQRWLDQTLGEVDGDMTITDGHSLRLKEHPMIEFINRVQMDAAGVSISATALFHNESKGLPKQISMRDIVSNYIYPNTLKVISVSGHDIKKALERSATYFVLINGKVHVNAEFSEPKPQHYNYDMWEGIEYTVDLRKQIGERIVKLEINGTKIEMNDDFQVVMNNYRAGGGGGYTMFKGKQVTKEIPIDMSELMANYIMKRKIIKAEVNDNWKIIW